MNGQCSTMNLKPYRRRIGEDRKLVSISESDLKVNLGHFPQEINPAIRFKIGSERKPLFLLLLPVLLLPTQHTRNGAITARPSPLSFRPTASCAVMPLWNHTGFILLSELNINGTHVFWTEPDWDNDFRMIPDWDNDQVLCVLTSD